MRSHVFADVGVERWRGSSSRSSQSPARLRSSSYGVAASTTSWLAKPKQAKPTEAGGARRNRTDDLMLAKHALSQLSYGPVSIPNNGALLRPTGFTGHASLYSWRAAPRVANGEAWWAWEDLNFRPHAYQARALTN